VTTAKKSSNVYARRGQIHATGQVMGVNVFIC